jgi:hypothetical protein
MEEGIGKVLHLLDPANSNAPVTLKYRDVPVKV